MCQCELCVVVEEEKERRKEKSRKERREMVRSSSSKEVVRSCGSGLDEVVIKEDEWRGRGMVGWCKPKMVSVGCKTERRGDGVKG